MYIKRTLKDLCHNYNNDQTLVRRFVLIFGPMCEGKARLGAFFGTGTTGGLNNIFGFFLAGSVKLDFSFDSGTFCYKFLKKHVEYKNYFPEYKHTFFKFSLDFSNRRALAFNARRFSNENSTIGR